MLQKIPIIPKNASNKSRWELNFLQKTRGCACPSPPGVELGGFKDCMFEIRYNVLKWKNRSTSGLNAAKNRDYIKKYFK